MRDRPGTATARMKPAAFRYHAAEDDRPRRGPRRRAPRAGPGRRLTDGACDDFHEGADHIKAVRSVATDMRAAGGR